MARASRYRRRIPRLTRLPTIHASDELPTVREKLSAAQRLDRQVQANGKAKGKGKSLSSKE